MRKLKIEPKVGQRYIWNNKIVAEIADLKSSDPQCHQWKYYQGSNYHSPREICHWCAVYTEYNLWAHLRNQDTPSEQ